MKKMFLLFSIFLVAQTQFAVATDLKVLATAATEFGVGPGATFLPYITSDFRIGGTDNGDWAKFPSVNFDLADFKIVVFHGGWSDFSQPLASLEVRLDAPAGTLIATVEMQYTLTSKAVDYVDIQSNLLQSVSGTHDVYIVGKRLTAKVGDDPNKVGCGGYDFFQFSTAATSTINIDADELSVYPNPAVSQLIVDTRALGIVRISLMNSNSQILESFTNSDPLSKIDVSKLPTGMYLLKIESEKGSIVKKVLVNK